MDTAIAAGAAAKSARQRGGSFRSAFLPSGRRILGASEQIGVLSHGRQRSLHLIHQLGHQHGLGKDRGHVVHSAVMMSVSGTLSAPGTDSGHDLCHGSLSDIAAPDFLKMYFLQIDSGLTLSIGLLQLIQTLHLRWGNIDPGQYNKRLHLSETFQMFPVHQSL